MSEKDTWTESPEAQGTCAPGVVLDGRYRLEEVLGRGGFATVYRATQLNLGSAVAVKVLEARRGCPEINTPRFVREARTASLLDHPGLVKVLDFGVEPQVGPFLVMELLKGAPLSQVLRDQGPMPPARALKLMIGALDALQEAHAQNVVHRDLKPANLFLCHPETLSESLRILDFGCAFLLEDEVRLTGAGTRLGTPQYIAPEYASKVHISPAQDVYQMAIIFCEMLLGRALVSGDSHYAMIMAHCEGRLALTPQLEASALWPALSQALRVDHEARFQDAGALRDALLQVDPASLPASLEDETSPAALADRPTDMFSGHTAQLQEEFHQSSTRPLGEALAAQAPSAGRARFSASVALLGMIPVLLLGGGALAWWFSSQPSTPTPEQAAPAQVTPARAAPEARAQPEPGAEASPMSASIYVEPPEAVLFQGTRRLGRGRATLDFAAGDFNPVQVRAELEGYQPQTYQLLPGQAPARLTLRKLPERAPDAAQAGATQAPRPRGTTAPAAPAQAEPAQAEPAGDTPSTKKRKKLGFFE